MTRTHTVLAALRRLHARVRATGESGTTMIEIVVAMVIMTIAGSIFVGAVVSLSRTTNYAQAVTDSATNTNQAYQALDRTVRYASAISQPGLGVGATKHWYVELQDTTSGTAECTQLRVNTTTQQLQRRTWPATGVAPINGWVPIASGITNGATNPPFVLGRDDNDDGVADGETSETTQHQELTIRMFSTSGPANGRVKSTSTFRLTALNSDSQGPTGPFCQADRE